MWCVVRVKRGVWRLGHEMFDVVRITRGVWRLGHTMLYVVRGACYEWCVAPRA